MELGTPIDDEIRARLRKLAPNQTDLARAIGRKQPWLNRWMNGSGNATIDDVIRIAAVLIGVVQEPLTDVERRVLRAVRQLPEDRREDVAVSLEASARRYPKPPRQESNAQTPQTPESAKHTRRGKR